MSIRWIASVGVVLCVAITSLSIYLGAVENVYRPKVHNHTLADVPPRLLVCQMVQLPLNTRTTSGASAFRAIPCVHAGR
jgi:hypothetical protein